MDTAFITGMGAFVSAMLIFVGSAFLLLSLVLGARLAYFVTASITLAFLLIMGVVWSINPLGPVGQLPEWLPQEASDDAPALDGPASEYPDGGWREVNEDDQAELTKRAELESEATKFLQENGADEVEGFPQNVDSATIADESSRFLDQDGTLLGATTVEIEVDGETTEYVLVAEYDPGNPLGKARTIALGIFVLLVLHLFGLSRSEKRARQEVRTV